MPFEFYEIEDELVALLGTKITQSSLDAEAVVFPDSEEDFKRAVAKPRLTVGFVASTAGDSKSSNPQVSTDNLTVLVLVQARKKRGTLGCHHLALLVRAWLTGYQSANCGRLMYKSYQGDGDNVYNPDNGIWTWKLEFTTSKLFVQTIDEESANAGPDLDQVVINDQF